MPYAQTRHGVLHYEVVDQVAPWVGERETILFHHGIGADPGIWAQWLPLLADRYRLVFFDMRGYGKSLNPDIQFEWSISLLSDDLVALADAVDARQVHLVGESIGGTIALHFTQAHPERVASLTVSNGAHLGGSIQRADVWRRQIDEQGIGEWSARFLEDRFFPNAIDPERLAWFARCQEAWSRDSILNALSVLIGVDMRDALAAIQCPVLLLHGDSSPFIPVSVMADLHARLPNSRLQVFAGARHGLPFSHATQCAQLLRSFLDSDVLPQQGGKPHEHDS